MRGAGALGRPRGMVWGGRREEGSGWGTHVYLWRIHFELQIYTPQTYHGMQHDVTVVRTLKQDEKFKEYFAHIT